MVRINVRILFFVLLAAVVLVVPAAQARIGVGVGLGKVQIDQPFKAGGVYQLPALPVLNTGDEPAEYEVTVEFHENIPQLWPERDWFSFSPRTFHLEPGQIQSVKVTLTLPVKTRPGEYFNYLEGHPINKKVQSGGASIGVAAASKLYFSVSPANVWQGLYYRVATLFNRWLPWSWVVIGVVAAAVLISIFRRFFKFEFGLSRKK